MDGHSLLSLKYEEAMYLLRTSGAEVEILLSQLNADKAVPVSEEEFRDIKAVEHDNVFQSPLKCPGPMDSTEGPCVPCIKHSTGSERISVIPTVHPEPPRSISVEDSSLNNIHCGMAVEEVSGLGKRVLTPVATLVTSKQLQCVEKHAVPIHNSHDVIRSACCVLLAEED
jgi:hypothetical protein